MLLDKTNEFADGQAVTATAVSTNVVDTNPANKNDNQDLGDGTKVELVIQVDQAATAAGAATVTFSLESAENAALSTNPVVHLTTGALAIAGLTAGKEVGRFPLPPGDYKRYLGVRFTVATGPLTGGTFSAFLVRNSQSRKQYASGFTV